MDKQEKPLTQDGRAEAVAPGEGGLTQSLNRSRPGERWVIVALEGDRASRLRLMDLGLVPGTKVETVRRSPLGDPTLYRVRSTLVALRQEDAALIQVRILPEGAPTSPVGQHHAQI